MSIEQDIPRIVGAASARLSASFDDQAKDALVAAVRESLSVVGNNLELEQILAGIYSYELHERALVREEDIARNTSLSIRSCETDHWIHRDLGYLTRGLTLLALRSSGQSKLVRCNMITVFVLIGYAVRTGLAGSP